MASRSRSPRTESTAIGTDELCAAARAADVDAVRRLLDGADLTATEEHGFTALHCAALGTNSENIADCVTVMQLLVEAGSVIEQPTPDGRTALYLAAEFSPELGPVELLINAGANPDVSAHGVHVVINAMTSPVQEWLSDLSGFPVPPPPFEFPSVQMRAADWKRVSPALESAFAQLADGGLVVQQDVGRNQDDGLADCNQEYAERGGDASGLLGFCFYSRSDLNRAKRTGQLSLSFWGAPAGEPEAMVTVGAQIVAAFTDAGFPVDWNGTGSSRPTVFLGRSTEVGEVR